MFVFRHGLFERSNCSWTTRGDSHRIDINISTLYVLIPTTSLMAILENQLFEVVDVEILATGDATPGRVPRRPPPVTRGGLLL